MNAIRFLGLQQARHGFVKRRHQTHLRKEFLGLNDRYLQDIGISRRGGDYRHPMSFGLM